MASGPLPPAGANTGLKLFVYGVGRLAGTPTDVSFLAQLVQVRVAFNLELVSYFLKYSLVNGNGPLLLFVACLLSQVNETGAVTVTIKTDSAAIPAPEAALQFVSLVVTALAPFQAR